MWLLALTLLFGPTPATADERAEVTLPKGLYEPFFRDQGEREKVIGPLAMDRDAVTNADFRNFVKANPQWRRSRVKRLFADDRYLNHWTGDLNFPKGSARHPVTHVSWFAARKYCEFEGKRLPTIAEWEYAADGLDPKNLEIVLQWYGDLKAKLQNVDRAAVNSRGMRGMHGQAWEWVEDFASVIMAGDSRSSNDTDKSMFCGAGSLKAKDPAQYATFMRFAHRSSLKAAITGATLGFRCVRDLERNEK